MAGAPAAGCRDNINYDRGLYCRDSFRPSKVSVITLICLFVTIRRLRRIIKVWTIWLGKNQQDAEHANNQTRNHKLSATTHKTIDDQNDATKNKPCADKATEKIKKHPMTFLRV